jgi:hypothetical protein
MATTGKKTTSKSTSKKTTKSTKEIKLMTIEDVEALAKNLDEEIEVPILDGRFTIKINKYFKTTTIKKYIEDLQNITNKVTEEIGVGIESLERIMVLNQMLIFKNFTSFNIPLDDNVMLAMFDHFLNTGIFETVMTEFDKDELSKLSKHVKEYVKSSPDIYKEIDKAFFSDDVND